MRGYSVAHVDEIPELDGDGCPMRPVRHHLGITGFGVTAWTGRNAGDRIINEHREETTIVAVGGTPGKPYDPAGWELWYPLRRLYEEELVGR